MDLGLAGKVALVTGGSRGIGFAIATAFAQEGTHVSICGRTPADLSKAADAIKARGVESLAVEADLTRSGDAEKVLQATLDRFGQLDILVNNVGGARGDPSWAASDVDWEDVLQLNFLSAVRLTRLAIPQMKRQGGGRIIHIASIYGREWGGPTTYNATKAAMISFSKTARPPTGQRSYPGEYSCAWIDPVPGGSLGAPPAGKPGADRAVSRHRFPLRPLWAS